MTKREWRHLDDSLMAEAQQAEAERRLASPGRTLSGSALVWGFDVEDFGEADLRSLSPFWSPADKLDAPLAPATVHCSRSWLS